MKKKTIAIELIHLSVVKKCFLVPWNSERAFIHEKNQRFFFSQISHKFTTFLMDLQKLSYKFIK